MNYEEMREKLYNGELDEGETYELVTALINEINILEQTVNELNMDTNNLNFHLEMIRNGYEEFKLNNSK